jgi:hypothetical protein
VHATHSRACKPSPSDDLAIPVPQRWRLWNRPVEVMCARSARVGVYAWGDGGEGGGGGTRLPARFPPAPGFTNKTTCTAKGRTPTHASHTALAVRGYCDSRVPSADVPAQIVA